MGDSIPETMRAIVVREAGGPEVLNLEQRPVPALKPGWSLVRVRARGLTTPRYSRVRASRPPSGSRASWESNAWERS